MKRLFETHLGSTCQLTVIGSTTVRGTIVSVVDNCLEFKTGKQTHFYNIDLVSRVTHLKRD